MYAPARSVPPVTLPVKEETRPVVKEERKPVVHRASALPAAATRYQGGEKAGRERGEGRDHGKGS